MALLTRFAVIISMYQSSALISGYWAATSLHIFENLPSVFFIILALVTMATLVLPLFFAYSKAALAILSVPQSVVTLKSMGKNSRDLYALASQSVFALPCFSR